MIIALRRHKNSNGHWPQRLEDVNSLVPAEILIDPINSDSFVYKLTEDNFILYSKGKNGIDDGGKSKTIFDPNKPSITHLQDDILFWPAKIQETF